MGYPVIEQFLASDLMPSIKEFTLWYARGYDHMYHMHEDPPEAPLRMPDTTDYSADIRKTAAQIATIQKMTRAATIKRYLAESRLMLGYYENGYNEIRIKWQLLEGLLAQAQNWNPPTQAHHQLRADMVRTLNSAIKECNTTTHEREMEDLRHLLQYPPHPTAIRNQWIRDLRATLKRLKTSKAEQDKKVKKDIKWINQLVKSLEQ